MSIKDVPYYVGLILGLVVGTLALRLMGVSGIFQLLGGLAVGVGAGWVLDQMFGQAAQRKRADAPTQCRNPSCGWVGEAVGNYCPRCGDRLA